jgi:hypothetical protein
MKYNVGDELEYKSGNKNIFRIMKIITIDDNDAPYLCLVLDDNEKREIGNSGHYGQDHLDLSFKLTNNCIKNKILDKIL